MESEFIPYTCVSSLGNGVVLVFAPHPDDEVFGCGGAIMRHVAAGDPVHVVIVTDGGHNPDTAESENYILEREQESIRAAEVLGYGRPVFWRMKDRELVYSESLVRRLDAAIQEYQADFVYAPSIHEIHPDHRALGMAAMEAVRRRGNGLRLAMYEVGAPLQPNVLLDISDLRERKQTAMRCFASQLAKQPYDQHIAALNRFRTYTLTADVTAAEAYKLVSAEEPGSGVIGFNEAGLKHQEIPSIDWTLQDAPLVSVIVRSIGRDELQQALESVAGQGYPNIEVIVVNARGADHPPLEDHCGKFPLRVVNANGPLLRSPAGNLGLEAATGRYLIFLDDDDWFLPAHIAGLVAALEGQETVQAAYAGVVCMREAPGSGWEEVHTFNEPFDRTTLLIQNYLPIHAVLFSRTLIENGCRFDEALDVYEDWDFWLQTAARTDFVHVPQVSAVYRISSTSGFGITGDESTVRQATMRFFDKWRYLWSREQLLDIMCYAKSYSDAAKLRSDLARREGEFRQHLARLEGDLSSAQRALGELQSNLHSVQDELRLIKQSRSWRLTRPLRTAGTLLRRMRTQAVDRLRRYRRYAAAAADVLRREGSAALARRVHRQIAGRLAIGPTPPQRFQLASAWRPLEFPVFDHVAVSFIVFARGGYRHTFATLESILSQTEGIGCEVIVVEVAGRETRRMLEQMRGVRVLSCREEHLARTAHEAASLARGDFLVFLRDGVVFTPGWAQCMLDTFRRDPAIGLVGPQVVSEKGLLLSAGGWIGADGLLRERGRGQSPHHHSGYNYLKETDYCAPVCLMLPRDLHGGIVGLDASAVFSHLEAADLAMRIRAAGRKVMYQGAARMACFASSPWYARDWGRKDGTKAPPARWAFGKQRHASQAGGEVEHGRRVLVLDACLPTPDQDSGSLRMSRLLELFQSLGYGVSFMPVNLENRIPYVQRLQERGIEVLCAPYINSVGRYLDRHARDYAVIVLSRVEVADRYIGRVRRTAPGARVIFDTVDLHFLREERMARLQGDRHLLDLAMKRREQELAVAAKADVTLVVSPIEQDVIKELSPGLAVAILSNIHETHGCNTPFAGREGILFIGGFNHPPNVDAMLYFVGDVLPIIRQSLGDVPVYIVGSNPPPEVLALASEQVHVTGYVEDVSGHFDRCRLSVAPLRYGAGVKGKMNMSMSYGLPVVATSIAAEGMHLKNGVDVLVGDDARAFADSVVRLYRDSALWARLSENGLLNVETHFSVAAATRALRDILAFKDMS